MGFSGNYEDITAHRPMGDGAGCQDGVLARAPGAQLSHWAWSAASHSRCGILQPRLCGLQHVA